jgi:hypothetical protein
MQGVTNGFDIISPEAELQKVFVQNHKSALLPDVKKDMDNLIKKELAEGNYVVTPVQPTIISALGAVKKSTGGIRPIHDCSLPENNGLNSYAPEFEHCTYESVDTAVNLLQRGYYAAKIDLSQAFRSVGISVRSQEATGLQWTFESGEKVFMFDRKLPYGGRACPTIFHRITQSIKRMMARRGYPSVVVYQDDFLAIGCDYEHCFTIWRTLMLLLRELKFKINYNKLVPPQTCIIFLGIQLDTVRCELSLPEEKLSSIRTCVANFRARKRVTKQQLQSLVGKLNFAARVVRGARLFLRHFYDAIAKLKKRHHKLCLRGAIKEDLIWWDTFLTFFNGVAAFIDDTPITPILTDSCLFAGGAFCNGDFYYTVWQHDYPDIADASINYKEAMIASIAIKKWGHLMMNKTVILYTDNMCAASILNKNTCKNKALLHSLQDMFWTVVKYNFVVKAVYMPGYLQTIPDAISRLHEHDGLLRVEKLINLWYMCHKNIINAFQYFNMLCHMSVNSLLCVLKQVMAWRKWKFR